LSRSRIWLLLIVASLFAVSEEGGASMRLPGGARAGDTHAWESLPVQATSISAERHHAPVFAFVRGEGVSWGVGVRPEPPLGSGSARGPGILLPALDSPAAPGADVSAIRSLTISRLRFVRALACAQAGIVSSHGTGVPPPPLA
jgi:hypothetical protein